MRSKSQRALRGIKKKDPRIYRPATDEADAATKVAECEGNTAKLNLLLSRAAYRDDLLTARAALEAGADPNSQNLLGEGPILSLCFKGGVEMLHLLLKYRASLGPDKFGVQALYHCVNHERLELISPMVRAGADVNAYENQLLQTPLHRAVFCTEGPKFVKLLLNLGADPRPVDAAGHTPLDLAELSQKRFGRKQGPVIKLLKEALKKWKNKPPPKRPRYRPKSAAEKMADKYIDTEPGETDLSEIKPKARARSRKRA